MSVLSLALFSQGLGNVDKVNAATASGDFKYTCNALALGIIPLEIDMQVKPTMSIPGSVEAGETIDIEDIVSDIELSLEGDISAYKDLVQPLEGNVDHFNLVTKSEEKNAVGSGVPIPSTPYDEKNAKSVSFTVEGSNTSFTAGEEEVEIKAGEILAQIASPAGGIPATCTPDVDSVIATVTVEENQAPVDDVAPVLSLNGENPMELEVGSTYDELGATATDDVDGDVTGAIEISGDVDTSAVGAYEVVYTVSDKAGNEATKTRIINVVEPTEDLTAPVITLNGDNPMELSLGDKYKEPGAKAEDNVDGDVTDSIKITGEVDTSELGKYEVIYTVSDAAGNKATETRFVNVVDNEAPVLTLNGNNPMKLEVGATYEERGATAEDNVDGDLTDLIETSGKVNTDEVGTYKVVYTVSDAAGNEATETRVVNVVDSYGEGYEQGYEDGYNDKELEGYGEGYEDGYEEGYKDGIEDRDVDKDNDSVVVIDSGQGGMTNGSSTLPPQVITSSNEGSSASVSSLPSIPSTSSALPEVATSSDYTGSAYGTNTLPNTATNNPLLIALGAGLLLIGGTIMFIRRKLIS